MIRLCFGTFAQILRLCKLENVTDPLLVGTMTRTVDPDCQYINGDNATAVSRLISCNGNLSNGRANSRGRGVVKKPGESISNVINAALKVNKMDVVQKFRKDVLYLLDEDKKERVVFALLDIIEKDSLNASNTKEDYYIIVILDESTMTFAIEPYDGSMFK